MPKNIIWLASYPKSGNTWVRLIINNLLFGLNYDEGISANLKIVGSDNTKELINKIADRNIAQEEFTLERSELLSKVSSSFGAEKVCYLKTHAINATVNGVVQHPDNITSKSILIVRNPFDAICSAMNHFNYSSQQATRMFLDDKMFLGETDMNFQIPMGGWANFNTSWAGKKDVVPTCVLRFEDLIIRPFTTIKILAGFLGLSVSENQVINAINETNFEKVKNSEKLHGFSESSVKAKSFFRSGKIGSYKETLSPQEIEEINEKLKIAMQIFGYKLDNQTLSLSMQNIKHVWP
jgi:hypothetical protein